MVTFNTQKVIYNVLTVQDGCSTSINPANVLVINFKGCLFKNNLPSENIQTAWL